MSRPTPTPALLAICVASFVACGDLPHDGSASLNGSTAFEPRSALATRVSSASAENLGFYITDAPVTCEQAKREGRVSYYSNVVIGALVSSEPIAAGDFRIGSEAEPTVTDGGFSFKVADLSLRESADTSAASGGTVTLTQVTEANVSGQFTAEFPDGGILTGTFDALMCPDLL